MVGPVSEEKSCGGGFGAASPLPFSFRSPDPHLEIQHSFLLEGDFDVDIGIFDGGLVEGYLFSSG